MQVSGSGISPGTSAEATTLADPAPGIGKAVRVVPIADGRTQRQDAPCATAPVASGVGGTPQSMLDAFLVTVVRLAGARAGAVRALTPEGDKLRLVAAWGLPEDVLAREALIGPCGVCGDALNGDDVRVADSASPCGTLAVDSFFEQVCTGTVAVPLEFKGRSVGVFTLFFDGVHSLRGEVIHLLRPVGQLFGLALENARLERENLQSSLVHERQTIAGELHDSLAQSLTFVRMRMPLLQDAIAQQDTPRAQKYCQDVNDELGSANRRMRELITHFRAGMDSQGLHRALEQMADTFYERTGVALRVRLPYPPTAAAGRGRGADVPYPAGGAGQRAPALRGAPRLATGRARRPRRGVQRARRRSWLRAAGPRVPARGAHEFRPGDHARARAGDRRARRVRQSAGRWCARRGACSGGRSACGRGAPWLSRCVSHWSTITGCAGAGWASCSNCAPA